MLEKIEMFNYKLSCYIREHTRRFGIIAMAVLIVLVSFGLCFSMNEVSIFDGVKSYKFYTLKGDIGGILDSEGYSENYDVVASSKDGNRLSIEVTPTFNVYVTKDGSTSQIVTSQCSVSDAIAKAGVTIGENDVVNLSLDTVISKETYIDIVTVKVEEKKEETVPALSAVENISYSGTGNSVISTLTPDRNIVLDENGAPTNYSKVVRVQATAYTYTGNPCSTGVYPEAGYIAVNPKVIPYGTKMYIVSADGKYNYGYAIAADTGGFINSRPTNVDLFLTSEAACRNFGRRDVYIYFLD